MSDVTISSDGNQLAVAISRRPPNPLPSEIEIWDLPSQARVCSLARGLNVASLAFSGDGRSLYVGARANRSYDFAKLIEFNVTTGQPAEHFLGVTGTVATSIALSPGGNQIVSGDSLGRVVVWDIATQLPLLTLINDGHAIRSVDWSSDGERIAAGKADGTVQIWTLPRLPSGSSDRDTGG